MSEKLTVLVTGVGGRIGPHLVPKFREIYHLKTMDKRPLPDVLENVVSDLSDKDFLVEQMAGCDVVVHLAAQADEAPFVEMLVPNNIVGVYNVFEAAKLAGVRRIVFASTCQTVMNFPQEHTVTLEDGVRPLTMYAATKVFGEAMGRFYHDRHGMEFVAIRIGAFQDYDSVELRTLGGFPDLWLSPRDCLGILRAAIEKQDIAFGIVFGTSITRRERLSRLPMKTLLGYEPVDDIRTLLGDDLWPKDTKPYNAEG